LRAGRSFEANLRTIHDFASRAKDYGPELIVFPENGRHRYSMPVIQKHATGGKRRCPAAPKMAKQLSLAVIVAFGSRWSSHPKRQVFVDAGGNIRANIARRIWYRCAVGRAPVFTAGDAFVSCKFDMFNLG